MNSIINIMLEKYNPQNSEDRENAIKEIVQEIVLSGLSHAGFFEKAAFYGDTALRIFYGINRFSEDLDFAVIDTAETFKLDDYFPTLNKEFESYGIDINVELKKKTNLTDVQSVFLKGNTQTLMLTFFPKSEDARKFISNQKIKIKFEVDTHNPSGWEVETKFRMLPAPYEVKVFDESTLFAGKIHAILCRNYKDHVKGRDYYDYLFYIGKGTKINLIYLENKLKNTKGIILDNETLTINKVKQLLKEKFETVNYELAKEDVSSFITNKESLNLWNKELFISTLDSLKTN